MATIEDKYSDSIKYYTDGSKNPTTGRVGLGVFSSDDNTNISVRISDNCSVYSSELIAIGLALRLLDQTKPDKAVILSDSLSALQSIETGNTTRPVTLNSILCSLQLISDQGRTVEFVYVPSHVDIPGNEAADRLSREALGHNVTDVDVRLTKTEAYSLINVAIDQKWDKIWEDSSNNLRQILDKPVRKPRLFGHSKTDDRIITRLRLGKTKLRSNISIMVRQMSPNCEFCGNLETIDHVFFFCSKHFSARLELLRELNKHHIPIRSINHCLASLDKQRA
ncbi:uncharacterized protein [Argopecten irradians]|uniref:uncharacterized protein n=1 Tax=Argopecten irradians TaxID=31199 RepID=UPI0037203E2B